MLMWMPSQDVMLTGSLRGYRGEWGTSTVAAVCSELDINISIQLWAGPMANTSASFDKEQKKEAQVRGHSFSEN